MSQRLRVNSFPEAKKSGHGRGRSPHRSLDLSFRAVLFRAILAVQCRIGRGSHIARKGAQFLQCWIVLQILAGLTEPDSWSRWPDLSSPSCLSNRVVQIVLLRYANFSCCGGGDVPGVACSEGGPRSQALGYTDRPMVRWGQLGQWGSVVFLYGHRREWWHGFAAHDRFGFVSYAFGRQCFRWRQGRCVRRHVVRHYHQNRSKLGYYGERGHLRRHLE